MTSPLYDRGYEDGLAGRTPDMHLRFHWQYRLGYATGRVTRENRDEMNARRNAA
jgi:hypothetical protein